ncbi:MAG: V-type ATP synthase subunit F [Candidatus Atribacteria bacterium]|nr:V-type ATP synthase subunit F [bacterium]MCG2762256.1 V-type ATP synthase subunit F [Candidatus Atribacteria bacterium]MCG2820782.1 V-type ATP synthase subunit F [Candidatus Atribacteria bacterium]
MCMYKIALVGDKDSIIGFQLLGISIFPVNSKEETINILNELIKEKYAAVFITEDIASQIFDEIVELQKKYLISVTIIPNKLEKKNLGLKILKKNIEKAIGTDILFRKEVE